MTSFRSKNYPHSRNRWLIYQEYAMQYYAGVMLLVMMGVMVKIYLGQSLLTFTLLGTGVAVIIGNLLAYASLKRQVGEVFFLEKHFAILSTHEILYGHENHVFPLEYANPTRSGSTITVHYFDRIVSLEKKDWEDFELVWEYFSNF